ncbi:MAG: hypothetical protein QXU99_03660 [Candidatus Bathyarchaeia archaeon]
MPSTFQNFSRTPRKSSCYTQTHRNTPTANFLKTLDAEETEPAVFMILGYSLPEDSQNTKAKWRSASRE